MRPSSNISAISLVDSIEVTIVRTETSTYYPPPPPSAATPWSHTISPSISAPNSSPVPSPPCTPVLANFPVITAAPFSTSSSHPSSPPPTYSPSPSSAPHTTPLSFFPSSDANPPPPPAYRTVPRTRAESLFWWGFLLPLLCWPWGLLHLSPARAERPLGFDVQHDLESAAGEVVDLRVALGEGVQRRAPSVKESLELWREEERLWAKRCGCALAAFIVVGSVFIAVVISVADLM